MGFLLQAYMEDHLRNRDRLAKEWQALCAYQAEPNACDMARHEDNVKKNRNPDYVPCECTTATLHRQRCGRESFPRISACVVLSAILALGEGWPTGWLLHGLDRQMCANENMVLVLGGRGLILLNPSFCKAEGQKRSLPAPAVPLALADCSLCCSCCSQMTMSASS